MFAIQNKIESLRMSNSVPERAFSTTGISRDLSFKSFVAVMDSWKMEVEF